MGVPKFFRWVTNRYPSILTGPITGPAKESNVDNLYLDMNGVIHECSHSNDEVSEDLPFEVICENIFTEIKRIVIMVNPQKLIYIAVDGVAPRAKLNQQRARRFRSSRDRLQAQEASGVSSSFDSNCITPGTEFMVRLSAALKLFIAHMLKTDSHWRGLKVHFSGSEVPGEGEHKIVSFVRASRLQPSYLPDVRHCILGADADMIMLALATHEPYFLVLRDVPIFSRTKKSSSTAHSTSTNTSNASAKDTSSTTTTDTNASTIATPTKPTHTGKVMNYVRINVLREFIVTELLEGLDHSDFDIERIIDDFVFLTFLVGNDFLPHLPAINIGDDAFDIIFDAYKTVLASEPGYLVHEGQLDIPRLELILTLIGVTEKSLFYDQVLMAEQKERQAAERKEKYALLRAQKAADAAAAAAAVVQSSFEVDGTSAGVSASEVPTPTTASSVSSPCPSPAPFITATDATIPSATPELPSATTEGSVRNRADILDREEACKYDYYLTKLHIDLHTDEGQQALREVVHAYLLGLQWCLQYYTTGCTSWEWFYPYHYGPFLQDMVHLTTLPSYLCVSLGNPLQPFQQLLACLPAASCTLLPAPYHSLMSAESPLNHFYPTDFETDLNGKKNEYEAVVILPFIEISLLKAVESEWVDSSKLSAAEQSRNTFGVSYVYSMRTNTSNATANGDFLHVEEIPFTTTPTAPFAAALIPGTTNPFTSIPGFPSRTTLLEVVSYTKGYGKSKASRKNMRSRENCYAQENEAFPMPGVCGVNVNVDVVFEEDGVGAGSSSVGSTGGSAVSSSAVGSSGKVSAAITSSSASNTMRSYAAYNTHSSTGGVVRLIVEEQTSQFLQAVAAQVATQSAHFHSSTTMNSDGVTTNPLCIDLSLSDLVGATNVAAYESALLTNNTLTTAGSIFGPVRCALQPVGLLGLDGTVSVKYVDVSHLAQVEQFILQRVLGNELLDSLSKLNISSSGDNGNGGSNGSGGSNKNNKKHNNNSGNHQPSVGFERRIVIGSYTGTDSERFVEWLNQQLYRLEAHLPVFTCNTLQYVVQTVDGEDVIKESVVFSG